MAGGGEGFLVGGDWDLVLATQGTGGGCLAAEHGGLPAPSQLGGGQPGSSGFLEDQSRGSRTARLGRRYSSWHR